MGPAAPLRRPSVFLCGDARHGERRQHDEEDREGADVGQYAADARVVQADRAYRVNRSVGGRELGGHCAQSGKLDTVQKDPPIPAASIPMMFDRDSTVSWVGAHSESTMPRAARTAENARMASRSAKMDPFGQYPKMSAPRASMARTWTDWRR